MNNSQFHKSMAEKEPGVKFVGRLASYKYFNMDQVNFNPTKSTLVLTISHKSISFLPGDPQCSRVFRFRYSKLALELTIM